MKFARYLQDTQTPEWKKAYIDYRGLKVQLGIIRSQVSQQDDSGSTAATELDHSHNPALNNQGRCDEPEGTLLDRGNTTSAHIENLWVSATEPVANGPTNSSSRSAALPIRRRTSNQKPSLSLAVASLPPRMSGTASIAPFQQTLLPPRTPRSTTVFPFFRDSSGSPIPPPLHAILFNLPATHTRFFNMLDTELEKVETFYAEREKEMQERAKQLREQLNELGIHRQMFYKLSAHSKAQNWTKMAQLSVPSALASAMQWSQAPNAKPGEPYHTGGTGILASESSNGGHCDTAGTSDLEPQVTERVSQSSDRSRTRIWEGADMNESERNPDGSLRSNATSSKAPDDCVRSPPARSNSLSIGTKHPLDPHEYQHAKRRLRKAVIEHYRILCIDRKYDANAQRRGLEVLNNYRILNLTGFRKALKKYEKITKNLVQDAYMKEKVETSAFVSGALVSTMLKEMEDLFAMRFERGDRKKAMDYLRVGPFSKTHHLSTFRSGLWLGLALPAIVGGFYLSSQEHVRASLPSWDILLFIYSIFLVPVLLALLIGINIAVWAREKINYVFIFDLNPRSRLDHHEYFELPSFLLCTLAVAFWCSLAQIGPPILWPLIWIALALVVMLNPIRRFMWGYARWWMIKTTAKLGASGLCKVEFADFWLGDQFCSLHYSFSNLFFVGCFYTRFASNLYVSMPTPVNLVVSNATPPYQLKLYSVKSAFQNLMSSAYDPQVQDAWATCGSAQNWEWYYILGVLPFLVRFIQSLRRYWDSRLHTHLINAGKYGMGMIYYFFYYCWKHQGAPHIGASYILFCFTASAYAIYACSWDFLMDWSLCKPHGQYPLLRPEVIFKTQIPSYYFALISNLCVRLTWLMYVPTGGLNPSLCAFIVSVLEMLRRVQWNFYRLENEHLGNMDQYRITREVPLPYNFEMHSNEEEEERKEDLQGQRADSRPWWKKRLVGSWLNGSHE